MKILKIHLENINSIKGPFTIDFEEFLSGKAMIFAITGPTGSGKTSILDAICAALYGRTPRLEKGIGMAEIMTHHTGHCLAEVTYEINNKQYRSQYELHRAGKKPDGKLQPAKMELVEADTNTPVESKIKKVIEKNEAVTGLDFNRFCKSILLAQGNFNAFLAAERPERAKLLEKITGTHIYSLISEKAYDKAKEEKNKLEQIKFKLADVKLLPKDEIDKIKVQIGDKKSSVRSIKKQRDILLKEIKCLEDIAECKQIHENCQKELDGLEIAEKKAASDLEKLALIRKTIPFIKPFEKMNALIQKCEDSKTRQAILTSEIPENEKTLLVLKKELEALLKGYALFEKDLFSILEMIGKIEKIIPLVKEKLKAKQQLLTDVKKQESQIKAFEQKCNTLSKAIALKSKEVQAINEQLDIYEKQKKDLVNQKSVIEAGTALDTTEKELNKAEQKFSLVNQQIEIVSAIRENKIKINNHTDDLKKTGLKLDKTENLLSQTKSDHQDCTKNLENLYAQRELEIKIQKLETMRQELVTNEPCPLCGSTDHPWQANTPEKTNITLQIEDGEKKKKHLEIEKDKNRNNATLYRAKIDTIKQQIKEQTDAVNLLEANVNKIAVQTGIGNTLDILQAATTTLEQNVKEGSAKLAVLKGLIASLGKTDESISTAKDKKHTAELDLREVTSNLKSARENKDRYQKDIGISKSGLGEIDFDLEKFSSEFRSVKKIYGAGIKLDIMKPEELENRLNEIKTQNDRIKIEKTKEITGSQETFIKNEADITAQKKELKRISEQLKKDLELKEKLFSQFETDLKAAGFKGMADFEMHRLTEDEVNRLEEVEAELANARIKAETLLQNNEKKLAELLRLPAAKKHSDNIVLQEKELDSQMDTLTREQVKLEHHLEENRHREKEHQDILKQESNQMAEFEKWGDLNELIGQKDGGSFRMFAQDLTLERLIYKANTYLEMFSKRYLLEKNRVEELGIMVIDTFFADRIRPVDNLSGGETFLVSLSLALGLSDITSRQTSINSLFLDEGFGTLDSETLETALFAIDTLNTFGKTVGIISHVEALKERIPLKIEVIPVSDGTSKISLVS